MTFNQIGNPGKDGGDHGGDKPSRPISGDRRNILRAYTEAPEWAFEECTFEAFNPSPRDATPLQARAIGVAKGSAIAYAKGETKEKWIWFEGNVGAGKSHLAAAIMNSAIEQCRAVKFYVVPLMLDKWRASYSPNSLDDFDDLFSTACNVDLLVLDDFSSQGLTEWAADKLYTLFNYRYVHRKPTVITSQPTRSFERSPRWEAIVSRLHDHRMVLRALMMVPDNRRANAI